MDQCDTDDYLINKETLYPGTKYIPFVDGTRIRFHYQTRTCPESGAQVLLDDTKKDNHPMEIVIGKKFKFEVWEVIVQKMALNEVAKFRVNKTLCTQYPFIAKTLRDIQKPHEERKHCCGMTLQNEGIGYKDLDALFAKPCDLEFIIEIVSIETPDEYEKESWQLNDTEKTKAIRVLREEGNELYKKHDIDNAEEKYRLAIGMIEQLLMKEKPHDTDWNAINSLKLPLLLNFAQCKLLKLEYYEVIEHCTEVLKYEPNNVKALYRRAKAHKGAWNPDQAKADYNKCLELDDKLNSTINRELNELSKQEKLNDINNKLKFQKLFTSEDE